MSSDKKIHSLSRRYFDHIGETILTEVFSTAGQERTCKSPSCLKRTYSDKVAALEHFCGTHLKMPPYICTCGIKYANLSSARRHLRKIEAKGSKDSNEQFRGISRGIVFPSPTDVDAENFSAAVMEWLNSNKSPSPTDVDTENFSAAVKEWLEWLNSNKSPNHTDVDAENFSAVLKELLHSNKSIGVPSLDTSNGVTENPLGSPPANMPPSETGIQAAGPAPEIDSNSPMGNHSLATDMGFGAAWFSTYGI